MPGDQSAAADRHEHRASGSGLCRSISTATVPCPAITSGSSKGWMNIEAAVRGEPLAVLLRLRVAIAGQHDFRAERLDRVDLDLRRRPRHDDDGAQAEALGREGDALRVIAGAGGDDAARALRRPTAGRSGCRRRGS